MQSALDVTIAILRFSSMSRFFLINSLNNKKNKEAKLTLKSGHIFLERFFGSDEPQVGEIIFNTSMSGYNAQ